MDNWIAIDFGTSTVKAAYLNGDGKPQPLELEAQGYTVPSVFHISKEGELSVGSKAEEMSKIDKGGSILFLKRSLKHSFRRQRKRISKWWSQNNAGKSDKGKPTADHLKQAFLAKLFKDIRGRAGKRIHIFHGELPTAVCLTVTNCYDREEEELLCRAATEAGFKKIELVEEALAAAWEWAATEDARTEDIIVLDCGGGTTDWTYVRRNPGNNFRIPHQLNKSESVQRGGADVDRKIASLALSRLNWRKKRRAWGTPIKQKARAWKEDYCQDFKVKCEFEGAHIDLAPDNIQTAIDEEFIKPVFKKFKPFVNKLKKQLKEESFYVLMVGGSHKLKGLEHAIEELGCKPILFDKEIIGPVLGGVRWFQEKRAVSEEETAGESDSETAQPIGEDEQGSIPETVGESDSETAQPIGEDEPIPGPTEDPRRLSVANHFREVAILIGERQDNEVVLAGGKPVVPGLGMVDPAAALTERADRLEKGGLRLAIVGTRSRGKSTLINALLGEELLPMGTQPTTAVITLIVNGTDREVTLFDKDDSRSTISREEFVKKCVLDPDRKIPQEFKNVAYAMLESDNCSLCEAGLELVDTLGFHADTDTEAEEITRGYLNQVDAVLLVLSDSTMFDKTDLEFIDMARREGTSGLSHVFFIINDRGLDDSGREEVMEIAKFYLADEFGDEFERHVSIVNAKSALDAKLASTTDLEVMAATNLPRFEKEIEQFLKDPARVNVILYAAVSNVLVPAVAEATDRMVTQKALLDRSKADVETATHDLRNGLSDLNKQIDNIQNIFKGYIGNIAAAVFDNVMSDLDDLVDESEWMDLHIGGYTSDYIKQASTAERSELSQVILDNINSYLNLKTSNIGFNKGVDNQLSKLSKTIEGKVTDFVKGLNRSEAPWVISELRKGLSTCKRQVRGIIRNMCKLKRKEIREIINSVVSNAFGLDWLFRGQKANERREIIKEEIREKLETRFDEKELKRKIKELFFKVFDTPSEKLREALVEELERRKKDLQSTLDTKRAGTDEVEAEMLRIETINTLLTERFDQICQSVHGRVLSHEEQQQLLEKEI